MPEIDAGDGDIWFHLAAEFLTALLLVAAGILLPRRIQLGDRLAGIALGALFYTTINSPGFYADQGEWALVGVFGMLAFATLIAAFSWIHLRFHFQRNGIKDDISDEKDRSGTLFTSLWRGCGASVVRPGETS